ncbi:Leucine-rich repeat-containing protein [Cynara cardunculus var. scolymus]|uniref:Leucine-rich repeat-containing protein n=1 Tax=Cynara cardunculus var. scolymus TaxID=59895 RepID=A0A118K620_CYNCS|nr:Leucine-rich repeat-containing protein [Cynara cardunculus var. scolymus]
MISHSYSWALSIFLLFHPSLSDENPSNVSCIESEKFALLEFKNDLTDGGNRLLSWNSSNEDCCKWYGITCNNQTGHVSEIHLRGSDHRFGGELNPSLLNMTSLVYLDLSCNDFGGNPIPTFIGSLHTLTYLNLSMSRFSGEIPSQLGNLSMLRVLSVHNVYRSVHNVYRSDQYAQKVKSLWWLSGLSSLRHLDMSGVTLGKVFDWSQVNRILPSSLVELYFSSCGLPPIRPGSALDNLSLLSILDLSDNNFSTNSIPSWISSLSSLVSLNLANCDFSGPIPAGLMNMVSLITIDLSNNQLTSIQTMLNSSPGNICNLREINLSWNKFNGKSLLEVLTSLFKCESSKLESLRFAASGLSGYLPPQLGNMKNLVHIDLNSNSISGSIPDSLGNLQSLQTLELKSNSISGPLPDSIGRLSSLLRMHLPYNSITGPLPDSLGRLSSLERLDISNNEINGTLPQSVGQLTKLMILNIRNNLLTGVVTEDHFANLTSLTNLLADANMLRLQISANNWEPPFRLQILILNSWSLGPKFPSWLQNQTNLSILYLASTGISDNIPSWFSTTLLSLQYLNLSDNNLSSVSLKDLFCSKIDAEQKQVIYLNLGNTNLSGVLPDCWGAWGTLKLLNFQNNNLTGEIPRSLASLMTGKANPNKIVLLAGNEFMGSAWLVLKGREIGYSSNLGLVTFLDLSGNDLSGVIPSEITRLVELKYLNFSGNRLTGRMPEKIGDMKELEALDLSMNELEGMVPLSMSSLSFLNWLNLSYNNLTGRIPSSTQLQSFEDWSFVGNRLCGAPVRLGCERRQGEKVGEVGEGGGGPDWRLVISIVVGFVVGFWIVVAPLMVSKAWRVSYFQFMCDIWYKFYDFVVKYSSNKNVSL